MNQEIKIYQEDEIDLREVWQTIVKRKIFIGAVTLGITVGATIYAFSKEPIYEVKTVFEIGSYSNSNSNSNSVLIESPLSLVKRLEIMHIANRDVQEKTFLEKVELLKGTLNLVEIAVRGPSNEEGIAQTNKIVDEVYKRHQEFLESYVALMKDKMKNLEQQREELLGEKKALGDYIQGKMDNIDKILKDNPAVAAVYTIDLNTKASQLSELKDKIYTIHNQLNDLSIAMSPNNLKPTQIMGAISKKDYPIAPKKSLIVAVSFVTGLMLSIFLVFFLEFIGKKNDE